MRKTILAVVSASIIAALTAQAAAAAGSAHHRTRANGRAVATEQFRNSNAYVAPSNIAVQPDSVPYSCWSGYDGAMGSGIAGH